MSGPGTAAVPPLPRPSAVFFDLDGTLADTAADLAEPINAMRRDRQLPPMPLASLRPFASMGARGLIQQGLGIINTDPAFPAMREEFLQRYEAAMCVHTRLFDGIAPLLDWLDAQHLPWGVVSNKVERYVRPILVELGLAARSVVAIGGDTTAHAKPHPAPLLHAAQLTGLDPRTCLYVGDDHRDVLAGQAAGMATAAVSYGYCGDALPPDQWGADLLIDDPRDLLAELARRLPR